jgi:hypothetical protein
LLLGLGLFGLGPLIAVGFADNPSPAPPLAPPPPKPVPPLLPPAQRSDSFTNISMTVANAFELDHGFLTGFFWFKNTNPVDVKDLTILCLHRASSGTIIGKDIRTIYEIFPAHKERWMRVPIGFIDRQVESTTCELIPSKAHVGRDRWLFRDLIPPSPHRSG